MAFMSKPAGRRDRGAKFTRQQVSAVADSIFELAGELKGFADRLVKESFDGQLYVDGGLSVYDVQDILVTWIARAELAKRKRTLPTPTDEPQNGEAQKPKPSKKK